MHPCVYTDRRQASGLPLPVYCVFRIGYRQVSDMIMYVPAEAGLYIATMYAPFTACKTGEGRAQRPGKA